VDAEENVPTSSPKAPPPHSLVTIPSEPGVDTPTHGPSLSGDELHPLAESKAVRKISSGASLTAMSPVTPSAMTPTTPALTPAMTGTTDDSDTDFQSAYSASPRESYGEFDEDGQKNDTEISVVEVDHHHGDFGADPLPPQYAKAFRRASHVPKTASRSSTTTTGSSTATAVSIASPTFSEDTVTSTPRATLAEVPQ
jgi:EEF1A N-terminal glycine/lysine methyltransferase